MGLKIATFNLKRDVSRFFPNSWGQRRDAVAAFFEDETPDLVGTQELTAETLLDMERMLPGYDWIGEGRGGAAKGEYCAIFYRMDKLTCLEHGTFWLARAEAVPNKRDWFALVPRICTWGLFESREKQLLRIYNTHLDHISPLARKNGLNLILEHMRQDHKRQPCPCVLTGDFNASPGSAALGLISEMNMKEGFFSGESCQVFFNAQNPAEQESKTYHGFRGKTTGLPIDYIFASKGILIEEARILQKKYAGRYPSDHFPIIMKIKIEI